MLYYETDPDWVPSLKWAMKPQVAIEGGICVYKQERKKKNGESDAAGYLYYSNFNEFDFFN